ncbi:MAG: hypothetical protein WC516_04835 [Patescibacteria group bacterium]
MKEANFKQTCEVFNNDINPTSEFNFRNQIHRDVMTEDKNFTYGHYGINEGIATVAGFRISDRLYFGVSLCSPTDNFSKAFGRANAEDNLVLTENSQKRGVMILDNKIKDLHPTELLKLALEHYLNRMSHKPVWVKNPIITFRSKKRRK